MLYRHDKNYCGIGAYRCDGGITGFSYLFKKILKDRPIDKKRLNDPARKLAVSATNMQTGQVTYFEKGKCNLARAIQASATVPYISKPVMIKGVPYLDGGCAEKIPYTWAFQQKAEKIIVVRTRELEFRRKPGAPKVAKLMYKNYPNFVDSLEKANSKFNEMVVELENKAEKGDIFLIAPSRPVTVKRFDGDLDKLADLYWLGYKDTQARIEDLKSYLGI